MEHSYRFFANRDCKYYPCHRGVEELNCLFCYCPLYRFENCPGNPRFQELKEGTLKICSDCTFPHRPENYDKIMEILGNNKIVKYEKRVDDERKNEETNL